MEEVGERCFLVIKRRAFDENLQFSCNKEEDFRRESTKILHFHVLRLQSLPFPALLLKEKA